MFNSIEGKHYSKLNLKPRFCTDVIRLSDGEEQRENAFKNALLSSLDKDVSIRLVLFPWEFMWVCTDRNKSFIRCKHVLKSSGSCSESPRHKIFEIMNILEGWGFARYTHSTLFSMALPTYMLYCIQIFSCHGVFFCMIIKSHTRAIKTYHSRRVRTIRMMFQLLCVNYSYLTWNF